MLVWHNFFYSNADFMVLMVFAIAQTKKNKYTSSPKQKVPAEILGYFSNGEQQGTANVYF